MKTARLAVMLAAAVVVAVAPGVAHAATITQSFHADSGDACHYGATDGTLGWVYGTTSPLPLTAVNVTGKLVDHPLPADPSTACGNDGYSSTATFTAYSGTVVVGRQTRTVDNGTVTFSFTLGGSTTGPDISRVEIQVCRNPVVTVPPSYCGPKVVYTPPPVA